MAASTFLALLLLLAAVAESRSSTASSPFDFLEAQRARLQQDVLDLAAIPSISALPDHQPDVERAADWLEHKLTAMGLHVSLAAPESP